MDEKFLYHIWDEGHLKPDLKTENGKNLRIVYQGQFNTNRGPDFCNVILELDGQAIQGDVEIHVNSYDWIAHNHHEDHHYNDVILHVVLFNNGKQSHTIKENGEAIEILAIKEQLSEDIQKLLDEHQEAEAKVPSGYCALLAAVDNDTLIAILNSYGRRRFHNKVHRFNAMLMLSDFDQVLYEGIMEALGYDKNKLNLLKIAQLIPLREIRDWYREGMTAVELIAVLCCSTGILKRSGKILDPALVSSLEQSYEQQKFHARQLDIDWQLFRIRPSNHPVFRLVSFGALLYRSLQSSLLKFFLDLVPLETTPRLHFQNFHSVLTASALPGAEKLPQPGQALVSNIYINIFLPIIHLYHEKLGHAEELARILTLYSGFRPLQENHITRFMSRQMSPAQVKLANSRSLYQQGLIELFYRHCRYHLCDQCVADSVSS